MHHCYIDILQFIMCFLWSAGVVYDSTNNYSIPFYMGGAVEVLGGVLVVTAAILKHVSADGLVYGK